LSAFEEAAGVSLTSAIFGKFLIELIGYLPKTSMMPYIWGQILNR
jgi:hypothetical protein